MACLCDLIKLLWSQLQKVLEANFESMPMANNKPGRGCLLKPMRAVVSVRCESHSKVCCWSVEFADDAAVSSSHCLLRTLKTVKVMNTTTKTKRRESKTMLKILCNNKRKWLFCGCKICTQEDVTTYFLAEFYIILNFFLFHVKPDCELGYILSTIDTIHFYTY